MGQNAGAGEAAGTGGMGQQNPGEALCLAQVPSAAVQACSTALLT